MTAIKTLRRWVEDDSAANFWEAHAVLKSGVSDIPRELLEAYYDKLLARQPEVRPDLEGVSDEALLAFAAVGQAHPDSAWASVVSTYNVGDPGLIRRAFGWLNDAMYATSTAQGGTSEQRASIKAAAADEELVAALQAKWAHFETRRSARPVGWCAILMAHGSPESIGLIRPLVEDSVHQATYDPLINDLWWLRPENPSESAREILEVIEKGLATRDKVLGLNDFYAVLGVAPEQETYNLSFTLEAKSGHRFTLSAHRDWRNSGGHWYAFLGKSRASFAARSGRVETNGLKLSPLTLRELPEWLAAAGKRLKSKWISWRIDHQQGFPDTLEEALQRWLAGLLPS